MSGKIGRDELIQLCTDGVVPQGHWSNRDTSSAQRQLGEARALLAAGCEFHVITSGSMASDDKTIWVLIEWFGFNHFEYGADGSTDDDTFYIPTRARLDAVAGKDWY